MRFRRGVAVTVVEFDGTGWGRWNNLGTFVGHDRKAVVEQAISRLRLPEVQRGLRAQLTRFVEHTDDPPRLDFAPEAPSTVTDGLGATLFFGYEFYVQDGAP